MKYGTAKPKISASLFGSAFLFLSSIGATQTADLELSIAVMSTPPYVVGDHWHLIMTVANHGPDPTGGEFNVHSSTAFPANLFIPGPANCPSRYRPIVFGAGLWVVDFPNLGPGEVHVCDVQFELFTRLEHDVFWTTDDAETTDPNPANNRLSILFDPFASPAPVPVAIETLSPMMLVLLGLCIAFVATRFIRG